MVTMAGLLWRQQPCVEVTLGAMTKDEIGKPPHPVRKHQDRQARKRYDQSPGERTKSKERGPSRGEAGETWLQESEPAEWVAQTPTFGERAKAGWSL